MLEGMTEWVWNPEREQIKGEEEMLWELKQITEGLREKRKTQEDDVWNEF